MFKLKIKLGNAAMLTARDVARKLRDVADKLTNEGREHDYGIIMDQNGNSVGEWTLVLSDQEED